MTSAPASASGRLEDPVPAAISKIRIPGFGAITSVATLRQALVLPRLSKSFSKSYLRATPSNMAETSLGSLPKSALLTRIFLWC